MAVWSVVNYSYAFLKSRIDPEFYQPRYLELEKVLSTACATKEKIKEVAYEIPEQYKRTKSEHLFQYNDISSVDINSGKISKNILRMKDAPGRAVFINQKDDVLISTVRPNRNANTIIEDLDILQISSNGFCNLRALNIDPNYLFIFSKTKYFRDYLVRFSKSSMYPAVANIDVLRFPFFRPKNSQIIEKISKDVRLSRQLRLDSESLYQQAQHILESELGLGKLSFQKPMGYTARFSEMEQSRRSDSEFFNPELRFFWENLSSRFELIAISKVASILKFSNPTYGISGMPIVTQKHLRAISPEGYGNELRTTDSWQRTNYGALLQQNDLLFYSVGAYLGKTNIWLNSDKAVPASFITLLRCQNEKNAGFLQVLLNSRYGILQSKCFQSGTSQQYIYPKDIRKFIIPVVDDKLKKKLQLLVVESYEKGLEAKKLLNQAKTRVEQLIEKAVRS